MGAFMMAIGTIGSSSKVFNKTSYRVCTVEGFV